MADKKMLRYYKVPEPLQFLDDDGDPVVITKVTDDNGVIKWWTFLRVFLLSDVGHFGKSPEGLEAWREIKKAHRLAEPGEVVSNSKASADLLEAAWKRPTGTRSPELMSQCEDAGWLALILDPLREHPHKNGAAEAAAEEVSEDQPPL